MSGGVDSSVSAALLQDQGYDVVGCFMRLGSDDSVDTADHQDHCAKPLEVDSPSQTAKPNQQGCCSLNDASDARLVAAMLDVPLYILNFKNNFGRVIDYFVEEYNRGRTPNPCVRCNDWLKFGKLVKYAESINADYVATGHYARIDRSGTETKLLRGTDTHKDQSYVLFGTQRKVLDRMLLPIGELEKKQTRQIAEDKGLPVHAKPDSYEICFVPDNNYARFIRKTTPDQITPGPIKNQEGTVLGTHPGHQHFTIGQRRGLNVALGYPIYVTAKNAGNNTVTIGDAENLESNKLVADQANWLVDLPIDTPINCKIQIRSNSQPTNAYIEITPDKKKFRVQFERPQRAISPGQAAVCYLGDQLIGGGWIDCAEFN